MPLDEARLAESYSMEGPQTAPPILLIHGIHLGRFSWAPHVEILRERFRVVTIDLPRHGTLADIPFTRENLDRQLKYITKEVLDAPPLIVGYSLGGYVAVLVASDRPQDTQAILICGTSVDPAAWRRFAFRSFMNMKMRLSPRLFEFGSTLFFKATLPRDLADRIISSRFDQRAFEEAYQEFSTLPFGPMLASYEKPICVVNGEWDILFRMRPAEFAPRERDLMATIARGDHVFPLRRPKQFCDIVAKFSRATLHARELL
ncbi:MAG: alpha/beta hydrolase [Candidatus Eremiobacteraeota bacterium]|nr:alpha/beta hydrolase [Candidatus Eremiobacteraeota bacterium]